MKTTNKLNSKWQIKTTLRSEGSTYHWLFHLVILCNSHFLKDCFDGGAFEKIMYWVILACFDINRELRCQIIQC